MLTDRQTDRHTHTRTDTSGYRVASSSWTRLKTLDADLYTRTDTSAYRVALQFYWTRLKKQAQIYLPVLVLLQCSQGITRRYSDVLKVSVGFPRVLLDIAMALLMCFEALLGVALHCYCFARRY